LIEGFGEEGCIERISESETIVEASLIQEVISNLKSSEAPTSFQAVMPLKRFFIFILNHQLGFIPIIVTFWVEAVIKEPTFGKPTMTKFSVCIERRTVMEH